MGNRVPARQEGTKKYVQQESGIRPGLWCREAGNGDGHKKGQHRPAQGLGREQAEEPDMACRKYMTAFRAADLHAGFRKRENIEAQRHT